MGIITDVFLPLALAFIMFALGLGLAGADFLRVTKQPKDFFVGAISQIILLPVIAFILVKIWPISPELAIGVMIIAAAPGGVTSNILTSFAKGDVALSVSFTAIISLISVVTVPIIVINSAEYFGADVQDISVIAKAILMFMLVTVPLIIGMLLKKLVPNFVLKFEPIAKKISIALFVLVLLGAIAKNREHVIDYFAQAGLVTFVLNLAMMIVAYFIAHLLIAGPAQNALPLSVACKTEHSLYL